MFAPADGGLERLISAKAITLATRVSVCPGVMFRELEEEAILLELETGRYFGLDEVGTRIWSLIADDGSLETAFEALLEAYAVAPEELEQDLLRFVQTLAEQGLVQIEDAS